MPRIWQAITLFLLITVPSFVLALVIGSSVAWLGGVLLASCAYISTLHARNEWAKVYAASQIRAGEQRAGSTDGLGMGGGAGDGGVGDR